MPRRSSSAPSLLILLAIAAFIFFVLQRNQGPVHPRRHESRRRYEQPYPSWPGRQPREQEHGRHSENRERESASCEAFGVTCRSTYLRPWNKPYNGACTTSIRNGYPVPDPRCTPGGINPTVTQDMLRDPSWRTGCIRNCQTTEEEKHITYRWYHTRVPPENSGETQTCELDHLVPLELGGADGLGNIWPQCGPAGVPLADRFFKMKDHVENYLADQVKEGRMPLSEAQRGIAADWTQYLPEANRYCAAHGRC